MCDSLLSTCISCSAREKFSSPPPLPPSMPTNDDDHDDNNVKHGEVFKTTQRNAESMNIILPRFRESTLMFRSKALKKNYYLGCEMPHFRFSVSKLKHRQWQNISFWEPGGNILTDIVLPKSRIGIGAKKRKHRMQEKPLLNEHSRAQAGRARSSGDGIITRITSPVGYSNTSLVTVTVLSLL